MAESNQRAKTQPRDRKRERETAPERNGQRHDYAAGADGEQDVDAGPAGPGDGSTDHAEREWGGDQDIDTAGMVPGNKATDSKKPTGF